MERGRVAGQSRGWQLAAAPQHRTAASAPALHLTAPQPHRTPPCNAPHPHCTAAHCTPSPPARKTTGGWRLQPPSTQAKKTKRVPFYPSCHFLLAVISQEPLNSAKQKCQWHQDGVESTLPPCLLLLVVISVYADMASSPRANSCRHLVAVRK